MAQLMQMARRERGITFEGSKKNYPSVDLPKWMKKGFESEEEIETQKF